MSNASSNLLPKDSHGCPYLFLAPMEGVGDRPFRKALASIGGFDEAVTEFISVPRNAHVESLAKVYQNKELDPIPLAAQIMGADPLLMAAMAKELERKGAPRIDINCGCPSNTVTGRGAGSSLLKDPSYLYEVAKAVVNAISIPVTIKMRSGYEDTSLFQENVLAAQESGVSFITLHPRTKIDGYSPPARWDLIQTAKNLLRIPLVGNGDIVSVESAIALLTKTNCDALMIGRGAVMNPFIFHQIRSYFTKKIFTPTWPLLERCLKIYLQEMPEHLSEKGRIGKLKQFMSFLFRSNPILLEKRQEMLKIDTKESTIFLENLLPILEYHYFSQF
ncbi:MAG: tRNA-dihydrouridine synthase family protein [Chlamydiota bacterium]